MVLQERSQEAPAAGDAGDETVEAMDSSQGGAVNASLVPAGRVESDQAHQQPPALTKGAAKTTPRSCRRRKHTSSEAGDCFPQQ